MGTPVWAHAAGLLVTLLLLLPVIGPGGLFSSDEGATLLVTRQLAEGGGWVLDHPVPATDPAGEGENYPFPAHELGDDGRSPYAKHPAHVAVLALAYRVGGPAAVLVLSCLAVAAAAAAAAALSRRVAGGHPRTVLWATGLATPLLFDAYLVMGHAVGAALCAAAVVAAVAAERRTWLVAGVAPAVAAAALVRAEAVLFGAALGGVLLVGAVLEPAKRRVRAAAGVLALGAAIAVRVLEADLINAVLGGGGRTGAVAIPVDSASRGYLRDRLDGAWHSLLGLPPGQVRLSVLLLLATTVLGALSLRRRPDPGIALVLLGLAVGGTVLAVAVGPGGAVTGLVPASPLLVAGVLLLRRVDLRPWFVPLATAVTFSALVVATLYRVGGATEWGGRHFAPAVPLLVPVAVAGLVRWSQGAPRVAVGRAAAALGLVVAALSGLALVELRHSHRLARTYEDHVAAVIEAQPEDKPVVVATRDVFPRFAWAHIDDARWLLCEEAELPDLAGRLRAAGVDRFVLVTPAVGDGTVSELPGSRLHLLAPPTSGTTWRFHEVTPA